jgi:hypothetical protein
MHKRFLLAASALAILAGCGGGGSSSISGGGGGPIPAPEAAPIGSAKFTVDARTGEVKVEPISTSRAAFSGGALSFTSSLLLSEGSPERRVLRVTAKNNTQETIGAGGSFKVLFSNFQNANTPLTDLRSLMQTSTFWGTGALGFTFGGQSTAAIQTPNCVAFDETEDTVYASVTVGALMSANGGTVRLRSLVNANKGFVLAPGFRLELSDIGISISVNDGPATSLVGGLGTADGDFATADFSGISDFVMLRATGPNDFEGVVADGSRLRRVERTPANPNGLVTTFRTAPFPINGVTYKDGIFYYTTGQSVVALRGSQSTGIGDTSVSGYVDGLQANVRFNNPRDLVWVGNSLFVADSGNNRIRQLNVRPGGSPVSLANWWVSTISGSGAASSVDGTGSFMSHNNPVALCKGPGETLFVADQSGHKIRKITPISNRFLDNFGDSTSNPTELVRLANPTDFVPSTPVKTPLILENQSIPAAGTVTLGDWQFNLPEGVKSFSFIITVESETEAPGVLPSVSNTGTGTRGSSLVSVRTLSGLVDPGFADGSLATAAFNSLQDITVTEAGDMFVCDSLNNSIRRISKEGKVTTILGPNLLGSTVDGVFPNASSFQPLAVASNPDGTEIYFSQTNHIVRRLDLVGANPELPQNWKVTTIAGALNGGDLSNTTGDLARFSNQVSDLLYPNERALVVADKNNSKIKIIELRGTGDTASDYYVRVLAGSTAGFNDGTGSGAQFLLPAGLALTKSGDIFVTDSNKIRRVDLAGKVTTFAGSASSGSKDSPAPLSATFGIILGIAAEPSGYLYVADSTQRQIRRIAPSGAVTTVAGNAATIGNDDGSGNTATFNGLVGLAVGPGGDVYVTDRHRVRMVQRIITN